jgi:hypothetical protein
VTKPIRSSRGVGCAVGLGVAARGCARGLVGVGLPAAFAVGLELLGDARRTGAFFAGFFLTVLVFLRAAALVTRGFLRFALVLPLAFFLVAGRLTQRRGLQSCSGFMVKCEGNGRGPAPTVTRCQRECVGGSQRAKNKSLFSNYCCCDDC